MRKMKLSIYNTKRSVYNFYNEIIFIAYANDIWEEYNYMNNQLFKTNNVSPWITTLLALACGVFVANLYYAQPLIGPISIDTHLSLATSGLIVTLTQIGYVLGLLFIVPLYDLIENCKLVVITLISVICSLIIAAFTNTAIIFLIASLFIGLGSVATQILVPYAAHLASEEQRGQVVGNVMSGLLLGIMLARPIASFVADLWGWHMVFILSAIITTVLAIILAFALPSRNPSPSMSYLGLLSSMWDLFKTTAILRRRALYQACLFGAFSLFWTVSPLWLANHFHLSQQGIALFALAGVAGAIAAPIAGRLADRGWTKRLTGLFILLAIFSLSLTLIYKDSSTIALSLLVVGAVTLDMAVSGNLVLSQRIIYSLGDEIRGRLNGIFMAVFFIGGAIGSAVGGFTYAYGSWPLAAAVGLGMVLIALLYYFTEKNT